jgi:uncharacterized protein
VKILLDTNVLIAAFVGRGVCADLLEHCVEQHEVFTSEFILDEFAKKLVSKFKAEPEETTAATHLLRSRLSVVSYAPLGSMVCRDSDDDNILAAAVSGECDCIITGDKDLLVLKQFGTCRILSPSDFLRVEIES